MAPKKKKQHRGIETLPEGRSSLPGHSRPLHEDSIIAKGAAVAGLGGALSENPYPKGKRHDLWVKGFYQNFEEQSE